MGLRDKFFSKKEEILPALDMSIFKVDMHSHLIPGIDDGSKTMNQTIGMLSKLESMGYQKVITTPHIMSDYYHNTPEIILNGLEDIRNELSTFNLNIQVEAAAEYYFDYALMDQLKNREELLTFGDRYVLFEFPFHAKPHHIDNLFFELLMQGYKPVVAHFERYLYFDDCVSLAKEWREKGISIQLNFNSIFGHYGPEVKLQAERLIDSGAIDFAATDCHNIDHLLILEGSRTNSYLHKLSRLNLKNNQLI
jgi:tyrosine-protein phosphatase YwqE